MALQNSWFTRCINLFHIFKLFDVNAETCPPVKGKNVDMTCYRRVRGAQIACNGSMPEGAVIYPRCKYQCHKEVEVDYQYIQCLPNGQWNRKLFKCNAG